MKALFLVLLINITLLSQFSSISEINKSQSIVYKHQTDKSLHQIDGALRIPMVNMILSDQSMNSSKKSAGLAILYSLLMPGMGELYAGDFTSGQYFTIAEITLWGTYFGMEYYGNLKRDNYKAFAQSYADVVADGKDEDYWSRVGEYSNVADYNDYQSLRFNYKEMYDEKNYNWNWNSEQDRKSYRNLWLSSKNAFNNIRFVSGAMILNRLVSVINAVRLVAKYNKSITETSDSYLYFSAPLSKNEVSDINLNLVLGF